MAKIPARRRPLRKVSPPKKPAAVPKPTSGPDAREVEYGQRILDSLRDGEEALRSVCRYELERELGAGGMGTVFLAHQVSEGDIRKPVAIKVLKDTHDRESIGAFVGEARLLASLTQGTIVELLALESMELKLAGRRNPETGRIDPPRKTKLYFMVQEYVEGPSFDGVLKQHRERTLLMEPALVGFVMNKSAIALAEAHTLADASGRPLNLVHRDISPSNILIAAKAGITKLADFGVARAFHDFAGGEVDEKREIVGKPRYMAPEQLEGRAEAASDIWALGVIAYEALTGYGPYRSLGGSTRQRVANLRRQYEHELRAPAEVLQPSACGFDLEVLSGIVMQCLRRNPAERPSAGELTHRLESEFLYAAGLGPTNKTLAAYLRLLACALQDGEIIPIPDFDTSEDGRVLAGTLRVDDPAASMRRRTTSAYRRDFLLALKAKETNPCLRHGPGGAFAPA